MCFVLLFIIIPQIFITSHKTNHEEIDYQFKRHFQCQKNKLLIFWESQIQLQNCDIHHCMRNVR